MEKILENIKKIRTDKSIKQEVVATYLGIEQASYALIESGKRKLRYETLEQIAECMKISVIDIITYPEKFVKESKSMHEIQASLTIQLSENKREEVIRAVFGDEGLTILER